MRDYPWLKHYDAGVPHTLQPYLDITVLKDLPKTLVGKVLHRILQDEEKAKGSKSG